MQKEKPVSNNVPQKKKYSKPAIKFEEEIIFETAVSPVNASSTSRKRRKR
jgi:hypothetical protein